MDPTNASHVIVDKRAFPEAWQRKFSSAPPPASATTPHTQTTRRRRCRHNHNPPHILRATSASGSSTAPAAPFHRQTARLSACARIARLPPLVLSGCSRSQALEASSWQTPPPTPRLPRSPTTKRNISCTSLLRASWARRLTVQAPSTRSHSPKTSSARSAMSSHLTRTSCFAATRPSAHHVGNCSHWG